MTAWCITIGDFRVLKQGVCKINGKSLQATEQIEKPCMVTLV